MTVFLDLDGPILDASTRYFGVYREIVEELGGATRFDAASFWEMKRNGLSSAAVLAADPGAAEVDPDRHARAWVEQIEAPTWLVEDRVWDGVKDWLEEMSSQFPLVLVTLRQRRDCLEKQLVRLDLSGCFKAVLSDSPVVGKGWETKCRLIAEGGYPVEGLMIGDTEVDIRAGKLLGLGTIAVSCGIRDGDFLAAEEPDLIVDGLTQLTPTTIENLSRKVITTRS